MGLARFVATDPYTPTATQAELEELLARMHGVTDCTVHSNGDVTLKYDSHMVADEVIEAALKGMGFKLHHLFDNPNIEKTGER
jgi:hypothetical protein